MPWRNSAAPIGTALRLHDHEASHPTSGGTVVSYAQSKVQAATGSSSVWDATATSATTVPVSAASLWNSASTALLDKKKDTERGDGATKL